MIKMKDQGNFETVPQIVSDIISCNTAALEDYFKENKIDNKIKIDKYISLTPLDIALIMECFASIKWLVEHKANLNIKNNPSFLIAIRYTDEKTVRYLIEHGAKVDMENNLKSNAYEQAYFGKKLEYFHLIDELGYSAAKHGGETFRKGVRKKDYRVMEFFLGKGVDINYNKPDMVYPFKPTPLCVAVRYVDFEMVKYLVEHGADITDRKSVV